MKKRKTYKLRAVTFAILTAVGLVLQLHAIQLAWIERGRMAFGGEWLTLPSVYLLYMVVMETLEFFEVKR